MAINLGNVGEPGSASWLDLRSRSIGGSDIGAIMGWSPYATREDIMQRKLNPQPSKSTKSQDRGHRLEEAILGWLKDRLDATLLTSTLEGQDTYQHEEFMWATYSPDALAATPKDPKCIFEAKTAHDRGSDYGWGRGGTSKVPPAYGAQVMWGMGILGYPRAYIGVLGGGLNGRPTLGFMHYKIDFNEDSFNRLLAEGQAFMEELEERKALLWD